MSLFRSKVKKYSESEKKSEALGLAIGAVLTAVVMFYWGARSHLPLSPPEGGLQNLTTYEAVVAAEPRKHTRSPKNDVRIAIKKTNDVVEEAIFITSDNDGFLGKLSQGTSVLVYASEGSFFNNRMKVWQILDKDNAVIVPYGYTKEFSVINFIVDMVGVVFCLLVAMFSFIFYYKLKKL